MTEFEQLADLTPSECSDLKGMSQCLRALLEQASAALERYNLDLGPKPNFSPSVRANVSAFCEARMLLDVETGA